MSMPRFYEDCYRYVEEIPGMGYRVITMPYLKALPISISETTYPSLKDGTMALYAGCFN